MPYYYQRRCKLIKTEMKYTTIIDIAKELGISKSTVSRALSGDAHNVKPETMKLICETAKRMGYQRNEMAVNLRRQTTRNIGIILCLQKYLSRQKAFYRFSVLGFDGAKLVSILPIIKHFWDFYFHNRSRNRSHFSQSFPFFSYVYARGVKFYRTAIILYKFKNQSMMQYCDRLSQLSTGQELWWQQLYVLPSVPLIGRSRNCFTTRNLKANMVVV